MYVEYRSASRGYQICVEEDLFGCFILYRRWFGLSNRRGGSKKQVFFNKDEAIKEFQRVHGLRVRRGYSAMR